MSSDVNNVEMFTTIGNIKFNQERATDVFGANDIFYKGILVDLNYDIVIREIKNENRAMINNDRLRSRDYATISYVLKMYAFIEQNEKTLFGYENYEFNLRNYVELNKNIDEDIFKKLLKDVLTGANFFHEKNNTINNISANNVAVCNEDNGKKSKLFKLGMVEDSFDCTKDVNDLGLLILSLLKIENSDKTPIECAERIKSESSLKLSIKFISDIIKQQGWIKPKNVKLLSHLIYCLLKAENCDKTVVAMFLCHPYFWTKAEISNFIEVINQHNPVEKEKSVSKFKKECTKKLNETFSNKYKSWQENLNKFVKDTLKGYSPVVIEMIRLMRNKSTHLNEESQELQDFCKECDGFINYFLEKHPDLLYDMFMYHWRELPDTYLAPFYSNYFVSERKDDIFYDGIEDAKKPLSVPEDPKSSIQLKGPTVQNSDDQIKASSKKSTNSQRNSNPSAHPNINCTERNNNIYQNNKRKNKNHSNSHKSSSRDNK